MLAVEDVAHHEWLRPSRSRGERTPDLRLALRDQRVVTVEITMATTRTANELRGAASKMRPKRARELRHEWKVLVSDHDIEYRDPSRKLTEYVEAMVPLLARIEAQPGTPEELLQRANGALDPARYRASGSRPTWWLEGWMSTQPWDGTLQDWARAHLEEHCDYWYPLDLVDYIADNLEPRIVHVLAPPVLAQGDVGGIHVHVSPMEHAFRVGATDHLERALQKAIDKKRDRGQLANTSGEKWLAVALDGSNAAAQLDGAFGPEAKPPYPSLSAVDVSGFDEVWAIAKVFGERQFVVVRLSASGHAPSACIVDMP